jgi:hypothetical protein
LRFCPHGFTISSRMQTQNHNMLLRLNTF